MSATSGDLLGLTNVFMPSGFTVAAVPEPPVVVPPRGGRVRPVIGPSRRPLPVEVNSRITLIGAAQPVLAMHAEADGLILFVSGVSAEVRDFAVVVSAQLARFKMAAVASVGRSAKAHGVLAFESHAKAITYNEAAVKIVLGLV